MNNLLKEEKVANWITPFVYFFVGLAFVVIKSDILLNIIFIVLGILIIILNLVPCIYYFMIASEDNKYYTNAILALISVIIGFIFIFNRAVILSIILGVWLIILPIIRIILSKDKKSEIKKSIPYFIVAILLFFIPANNILDIVLKIFGVFLMVIGVAGIIYNIALNHKNKNGNNSDDSKREIIDVEYKEL